MSIQPVVNEATAHRYWPGQDPLTFVVIPLLLATVALGACLIPARRATRMNGLAALRYE